MEDKCICCGANVSDLSIQICSNCANKTTEFLSRKKYSKTERICRQCWKQLLQKHNKRITLYLNKSRKPEKNRAYFFNLDNSQNETDFE